MLEDPTRASSDWSTIADFNNNNQQMAPHYPAGSRDLGSKDTGKTIEQVTGHKMVPEQRTVMEPQWTQQPRTVYDTHSRSVQVPRVIMEDHVVQTQHPKMEVVQNTIQVCDPSQSPGMLLLSTRVFGGMSG